MNEEKLIACPICGHIGGCYITVYHLRSAHGLTPKQFIKLYPQYKKHVTCFVTVRYDYLSEKKKRTCKIFEIEVTNNNTGEVKIFKSQSDCSKLLGINKKNVGYYVKKGYYKNYSLVKTNKEVHRSEINKCQIS